MTFAKLAAAMFAGSILMTPAAYAACSNTSAGFDSFKKSFAKKAAASGVGKRGRNALAKAKYSNTVIKFDRKQARYFKSAGRSTANFNKFYAKKTSGLKSRVNSQLKKNRKLFNSLEGSYGVQREVLATIWGMETNFGGYTGRIDTVNALATLSHDCRRTGLFQPNLMAALKIIDKGWLPASSMKGAGHGELGQTQFMAENYLKYAVDYNGDGRRDLVKSRADALASTANFLRRHGWKPMQSYQPGSHNFRVFNSWNESTAYQRTIAKFAASL
ncbi:MAG: lytic murein transglycosylase [Pseudomonadota bacterium]